MNPPTPNPAQPTHGNTSSPNAAAPRRDNSPALRQESPSRRSVLLKRFSCLASALALSLFLSGCVGSPIHESATYNGIQTTIKRNNKAILALQAGMAKPEVEKSLGAPARSEGYPWGSVWLYRTTMSAGAYVTPESDYTPLVFDTDSKLTGWGRDYLIDRRIRYEVQLRQPQ